MNVTGMKNSVFENWARRSQEIARKKMMTLTAAGKKNGKKNNNERRIKKII